MERPSGAPSSQHTGLSNPPLTEAGENEARSLINRFSLFQPTLVFTSPLRRSLDTCRLAGFADSAVIDDRLVEWDYGDYEGLTFAEIEAHVPGWKLFDDGAPSGESAADVGARADSFLGTLGRDARLVGKSALVFSHGHMLHVLAARWLGLAPGGARYFELDSGGVGVLSWKRGRARDRALEQLRDSVEWRERRPAAAGAKHHVLEGERVQVVAHVLSDVSPYCEEHALALMVAGAVLVRLTEVSDHDRTVDGAHDLTEGDLVRQPCQDVPATHTALGPHEAGALESQQYLLEIGLGEASALGDVAHRCRRGLLAKREREQSAACVVTAGRHLHSTNRTAADAPICGGPGGRGRTRICVPALSSDSKSQGVGPGA